MRKLLLTTAAVAAAIAGAVAAEPSFGTFTDTRDGKTYKTVKIGGQTWMAKDMYYKTTNGSWCYNDSISDIQYCKEYGRLYTWNAAKKACPVGYHLPSRQDWTILVEYAGGWNAGRNLKATIGWIGNTNGYDKYGFSAMPGGYRESNGSFYNAGNDGTWWTATEEDGNTAYVLSMGYYYGNINVYVSNKSTGYSVRCVADRP